MKPEEFYDKVYPLPAELLQGKTKVTVKLQAHPGNFAGGVFGVRVARLLNDLRQSGAKVHACNQFWRAFWRPPVHHDPTPDAPLTFYVRQSHQYRRRAYKLAKERYAALGVDTDKVIKQLAKVPCFAPLVGRVTTSPVPRTSAAR